MLVYTSSVTPSLAFAYWMRGSMMPLFYSGGDVEKRPNPTGGVALPGNKMALSFREVGP
jgi:hypothetical protein